MNSKRIEYFLTTFLLESLKIRKQFVRVLQCKCIHERCQKKLSWQSFFLVSVGSEKKDNTSIFQLAIRCNKCAKVSEIENKKSCSRSIETVGAEFDTKEVKKAFTLLVVKRLFNLLIKNTWSKLESKLLIADRVFKLFLNILIDLLGFVNVNT